MGRDIERRVNRMVKAIEKAAVRNRLCLTIHEGKIGFVDLEQRKIVALWTGKNEAEGEINRADYGR